jgi:hypothetical protein
VKDDKDEHRNECNIHELPLGHTRFTTMPMKYFAYIYKLASSLTPVFSAESRVP